MTANHVRWAGHLFGALKDGGRWGVPRSGLVFRRDGDNFVLAEKMPWTPELPITAEELAEQQATDIAAVREHFEAAGVKVCVPS